MLSSENQVDQLSKVNYMAEYRIATMQQRDVSKAISLAYYYSNVKGAFHNEQSLIWLCEAKKYLKNKQLSKVIDLDQFLQRFKIIDAMAIFRKGNEEIANAVAKCSSIIELNFYPPTVYLIHSTKKIGACLAKTKSIEKVVLGSTWSDRYSIRLNNSTLTPITDALKINTSIKSLDLADTSIGDSGVEKLVDAIWENTNSQITKLNLIACNMTDTSATKLLELFRSKKQITAIYIKENGISQPIAGEFCRLNKERSAKKQKI